jgi:hypothetical protein
MRCKFERLVNSLGCDLLRLVSCASPIFGPHESRALTGGSTTGRSPSHAVGGPDGTGRENQNGGNPVPAKPSSPSLDGRGSDRIRTPVRGVGRRNVATTMAGPCRSGRAFGREGKEEGVVGMTETGGQRATAGTRPAPRLTTERSQTNVHGFLGQLREELVQSATRVCRSCWTNES